MWNSRVTREGYHSVPVAVSKGSAINSTAITQQPLAHSTPTSPTQNSLTIPPGVDPTEDTLKAVINDHQIPRSFLKEAFDDATSKLCNFITPQKPDGAHNDASLDTNSETSETSTVNDDKVPPPNSKTYSQKDVDHLLEQSRLQDITDKRNLETHICNQYSSAMEHLKMEHQEQIASKEQTLQRKCRRKFKRFRPLQTNKLHNMLSPYNCSNKKFKHYNNLNQTHPTCQTTINPLIMRLS